MRQVGRLAALHVSPNGGVPKHPVAFAEIAVDGIIGDRQRNTARHGGPLRAVSLFALERIQTLRSEGHPIAPGTAGENLTVSGLDWPALVPGCRLTIGDWVELEVLSYVTPCSTIMASFRDGDFLRISQQRNPGWSRIYARVITPGSVSVGDMVTVEPPAQP